MISVGALILSRLLRQTDHGEGYERQAQDLVALGVTVLPDAPRPGPHWEWDGHAGHFIGATGCRFHLNTRIGRYRVSTVGDWFPHGAETPQALGINGATHETMVFELGEDGDVLDWGHSEDTQMYKDCNAATAGHLALCQKYTALQAES